MTAGYSGSQRHPGAQIGGDSGADALPEPTAAPER